MSELFILLCSEKNQLIFMDKIVNQLFVFTLLWVLSVVRFTLQFKMAAISANLDVQQFNVFFHLQGVEV